MMLEDIAEYLEDGGIGTLGTDILLASEPTAPDNCITLYEYAGGPPSLLAELENPGLQVRVRNTSWYNARVKLESIKTLLQKIGNEFDEEFAGGITINSTFYAKIFPTAGITPLGEDEKGRSIITQSYIITKGE